MSAVLDPMNQISPDYSPLPCGQKSKFGLRDIEPRSSLGWPSDSPYPRLYGDSISYCLIVLLDLKVLFTNTVNGLDGKRGTPAEAIDWRLPLFDSHGRTMFTKRCALVLIPLVCSRLVLFRSGQDVPNKRHGQVRSHDMSISSAPWPLFFRSSDLFCVAAFASSIHFS